MKDRHLNESTIVLTQAMIERATDALKGARVDPDNKPLKNTAAIYTAAAAIIQVIENAKNEIVTAIEKAGS